MARGPKIAQDRGLPVLSLPLSNVDAHEEPTSNDCLDCCNSQHALDKSNSCLCSIEVIPSSLVDFGSRLTSMCSASSEGDFVFAASSSYGNMSSISSPDPMKTHVFSIPCSPPAGPGAGGT